MDEALPSLQRNLSMSFRPIVEVGVNNPVLKNPGSTSVVLCQMEQLQVLSIPIQPSKPNLEAE
jgi:hypothetical protein